MSRVTAVVLVCSVADERVAQTISDKLVMRGAPPLAPDVSERMITGGKHPQVCVRGTGINYGSVVVPQLVEDFRTAPWFFAENAVLLIEPEDEKTQVHRPAGFSDDGA